MQKWNEAFKSQGKIFTEVQEDIPKISELFKEHGVKRVLDLGFGSGRHTVYFAREGFEVFGIDISREGLRLTRAWLKEERLTADLRIGNIYEKLPYLDSFFDAIVTVQVMHHSEIDNIRKLISEIERVLRSPGLVFVTVLGKNVRPSETIAPRTFIPLEGPDKGSVHYLFTKRLLRREFSNFKITRIWADATNHYCFLGELRK